MKSVVSYYKEEQRFRSTALVFVMGILYVGIFIFLLIGAYRQWAHGITFGDKPMSNAGLIVMLAGVLIVEALSAYLLFGSRLVVEIDSNGINTQFWPYFRKIRTYTKNEIAHYEIRSYSPVREFGGWGVRYGSKKKGMAYNVKGNMGLQLVFTNGRKLLIGTQQPDAMLRAVKKMMSLGDE